MATENPSALDAKIDAKLHELGVASDQARNLVRRVVKAHADEAGMNIESKLFILYPELREIPEGEVCREAVRALLHVERSSQILVPKIGE